MHKVNVWHIGNLLGSLLGLGGAEYERLRALDSGAKDSMRELFAARLAPAYRSLPRHGQRMLKRSLQHFLNTRSDQVGDMIAALQDVPLSADDPYTALEALWEALFPAEDYRCADLRANVEDNDSATGNEIFAPEGGWPK
jgi:hypothetical protein